MGVYFADTDYDDLCRQGYQGAIATSSLRGTIFRSARRSPDRFILNSDGGTWQARARVIGDSISFRCICFCLCSVLPNQRSARSARPVARPITMLTWISSLGDFRPSGACGKPPGIASVLNDSADYIRNQLRKPSMMLVRGHLVLVGSAQNIGGSKCTLRSSTVSPVFGCPSPRHTFH